MVPIHGKTLQLYFRNKLYDIFLVIMSCFFIFAGCERDIKKTTGERHFNHDHCYINNAAKPNQQYPIILYRHTSFTEAYVPVLEKAIAAWESAAQKKFFQLSTEVIASDRIPAEPDGKYIIYWQTEWSNPPQEVEQGRTYIYEQSDAKREVIVEADILINASMQDFSFFIDTPKSKNEVHLESVLIHELGHVLGLEHTPSQTSIMYTHLKANEIRNQIPEEDSNKLKCL